MWYLQQASIIPIGYEIMQYFVCVIWLDPYRPLPM